MSTNNTFEGGCSCSKLRYRMNIDPLIVHACHCRQCQRVTGSAFVLNAIIEKDQVDVLSGNIGQYHFPGTFHTAFFCPECVTYVWSQYNGGSLGSCWFVRVGSLDEPDRLPPDVHIFTSSKQPWILIPKDAPRFEEYFNIRDIWRDSSIARMEPYWRDCQPPAKSA
jgi:hypothetical protein